MKTYMVTITETMQKTVEVEANSREEAERMVEQRWNDSEYAPGHLVGWIFLQEPLSAAVTMNDERSFLL